MLSRRVRLDTSCALMAVVLLYCGGNFDEGTGLYHDDGNGFFVRFPAGWHESASTAGALITVTAPDERAQINMVVRELPQSVTFNQYVDQLISRWGSLGGRKVEEGEMLIGGVGGFWTVRGLSVAGRRFMAITYSVMNGPKVYSVICMTIEADFQEYRSVFEEVAGSLMFIS